MYRYLSHVIKLKIELKVQPSQALLRLNCENQLAPPPTPCVYKYCVYNHSFMGFGFVVRKSALQTNTTLIRRQFRTFDLPTLVRTTDFPESTLIAQVVM